jgi:hypothetical protein
MIKVLAVVAAADVTFPEFLSIHFRADILTTLRTNIIVIIDFRTTVHASKRHLGTYQKG